MMNRPLMTTLAAVAVAATAACTTTAPSYSTAPVPASTYSRPAPYSDEGVVRAIDVIPVASRPSGAGAILGAIVGGVVGNTVERSATKEDAVEILVQLHNGERRSIVQGKGSEVLAAGDPVILTTSGGKVRVIKAPPIVATPAHATQ